MAAKKTLSKTPSAAPAEKAGLQHNLPAEIRGFAAALVKVIENSPQALAHGALRELRAAQARLEAACVEMENAYVAMTRELEPAAPAAEPAPTSSTDGAELNLGAPAGSGSEAGQGGAGETA